MARYTKTGTPSTIGELNSQLDLIETAIGDTLSRVGDNPNQMEDVLDMNSNRIINLPAPLAQNEPLRLKDLVDALAGTFPIPTPVTGITAFDSFSDMVASTPAGDICSTLEYATGTGVGQAFYSKSTTTGTIGATDGGSYFVDSSGTQWNLIHNGSVSYEQFGADLTGGADSWTSMYNCHEFANTAKIPVVQNRGVFYMARRSTSPFAITVKTNWDLGGATIVLKAGSGYPSADLKYLFEVRSYESPVALSAAQITSWNTTYVASLKKESTVIPTSIFGAYKNAGVRLNGGADITRSSGVILSKGELAVIVDGGGLQTPLTKDYTGGITSASIFPADKTRLVINSPCWELNGVTDVRALVIRQRHNVTVKDGVVVEVVTQPAAVVSRTFFAAIESYDIEWNNIRGEAWTQTTAPEGLYLFGGNYGANWRYINCIGTHGWGASGLNYLKNVTFRDCSLNRYDIHWAGYDLLFDNCDMHNWGTLCSGGNQMTLKNCRYYLADSAGVAGDSAQYSVVQTRIDYGSEWDGDITVDGLEIIIGADFTNTWSKDLSVVKFPVTSGNTDYGRATILGRTVTVKNVKIYMDDPSRYATIDKNWVMVNYEFDSNANNDYYIAHTINVSNCTIVKPLPNMAILAYLPPEHYKDTIKALYNATSTADGDFNQIVNISYIDNCKGLKTSLANTKLEIVKFGGDLTDADAGWATRTSALRPLIKIDNCTGVSAGIAVNGNVEITNSEVLVLDDVANTRPTNLFVRANNCKFRFLDNGNADYLLPMEINIDNSLFYISRTATGTAHTLNFTKWSGATGYEVVKGAGNKRVSGFLSSNDPVGFFAPVTSERYFLQNVSGSGWLNNGANSGAGLNPSQAGSWRNVSGSTVADDGFGLYQPA